MTISIGDQVRLISPQPYLITADPMPMLRPSDLVGSDESGAVVALHPLEIAAVRFRRGTFLIPIDRLRSAESENEQ